MNYIHIQGLNESQPTYTHIFIRIRRMQNSQTHAEIEKAKKEILKEGSYETFMRCKLWVK